MHVTDIYTMIQNMYLQLFLKQNSLYFLQSVEKIKALKNLQEPFCVLLYAPITVSKILTKDPKAALNLFLTLKAISFENLLLVGQNTVFSLNSIHSIEPGIVDSKAH